MQLLKNLQRPFNWIFIFSGSFFDIMPPKANKKKKKSNRIVAQSTSGRSLKTPPTATMRRRDGALKRRNAEWEASPLKNALIQQIRDDILSQEHISIDNALCLGLGTMDATRPHSNSEASLYQLLVFETTLECLSMKISSSIMCLSSADLNWVKYRSEKMCLRSLNRRKVHYPCRPLPRPIFH